MYPSKEPYILLKKALFYSSKEAYIPIKNSPIYPSKLVFYTSI